MVSLLLMGLSAWAAEPLTLLGDGPVVADGSPVLVSVWGAAIGPDSKLKAKATGAKVDEITVIDDVATLRLLPNKATAPGTISLSISGKGLQGEVSGELSLAVVPPHAPLSLRFEPPLARLGVDGSVLVRIDAPAGPQAQADRKLLLGASVGKVEAVSAQPDGSFIARYTPPPTLDRSQVVLITAVDAANPGATLAAAGLPLVVRRSVTVSAPPGTVNQLVLGDRTYGPLPASPAGTVAFDVELDPTKPGATLKTTVNGATTSKSVDLAFGEAPVFALAPTAGAVVADPGQPIPLTLVALTPDGKPYVGPSPSIGATLGSVGPLGVAGPGRFTAAWTPPAQAGAATLTAALGGVEQKRPINLVAGLPQVSLNLSTTRLEAGQKDVGVVALVKDAAGASIVGVPPEIGVDGLDKVGKIVDNKDGSYKIATKLKAGADSVLVLAAPAVKSAGNPPARLLLWPVDADLAVGQPGYVVAAVVDAYGAPVPDVALRFRVPQGAGGVSPTAKTDARGLAWASTTSGEGIGPTTVEVAGAGLVEETVLFHLAAGASAPKLPTDPLAERWRKAVGAGQVELPGVVKRAPVVAAAAPTPVPAPVAAAPVAAAPSVAPSATPRAKAPQSSGGAGARLSASLMMAPRSYEMSAKEPGDSLPPEAAYVTGDLLGGDLSGGAGLDARAVFAFGDTWGAELRGRYAADPVEAGHEDQSAPAWEALAGARYGAELADGLRWYGAGGLHRFASSAFTYADLSKVDVEIVPVQAVGLRVGGGLNLAKGPFFAELELAETLGAGAHDHHLGVELAYGVNDKLGARLGLDLEKRHLSSTIDGADLEIDEGLQSLMLGVTAAFP